MAQPSKSDKKLQQQQRHARLAAELRSNLRKRKQQARSRELREAPEGARDGDGPTTAAAPAGRTAEVA